MEEKTSIEKVPAAEPVVISDAQEGEKTEPSPVNTLQKREDGTDYPSGLKLFLINLAMCLSVFLMALGILFLPFLIYCFLLNSLMVFRHFYHCNCHSQNHGSI